MPKITKEEHAKRCEAFRNACAIIKNRIQMLEVQLLAELEIATKIERYKKLEKLEAALEKELANAKS
jgi:hypothetical protein